MRGEKVFSLDLEAKQTYASISKCKTFTPPSARFEYVKAQLYRNTESAFIKLRRYRLRARRILIHLREQQFKSSGMEADLNRATNCPLEAFGLILDMLKNLFKPGTLYRQTGIVLSCLEEDQHMQFELFEDPVRMQDMRRLACSLDEINRIYGKHTVRSAATLYLEGNTGRERKAPSRRNALPERKRDLLPGENKRQRIGIPVVKIRV